MLNSKFNYLSMSFLVSSIGDWLYRLALPIIILEKTGSAYHAAAAFGVSFIPWIIFSLIGGSLADNFNKRRILIFGNSVATLLGALLILVIVPAEINFGLLYVTVFLLASVDPLIHPSFQSIIPELVPEQAYVKANATIQTIDNTLSILGPLLGGTFVVTLGGVNALWIDVVSFSLASLFLLRLPKMSSVKQRTQKIVLKLWSDILEGARYSFHQRVIFSGSLMFLFTNFALNLFEANFIYYMTRILKLPIIDATIAMAIGGGGALVAGVIGSNIIPRFKAGQLLSSSTILAGLSTLLLLISDNYLIIGLILGLISFFGTINVITYFSLRQRTIPKDILGRVVAVTRMVSYASIPVGSFVGGWLLSHGYSMILIIILAGSIRALAGIGARFSPLGKEK